MLLVAFLRLFSVAVRSRWVSRRAPASPLLRKRTVRRIPAAVLVLAGCAALPPRPFLGVPEDRALLIEEGNPQTPLRGIPKVTEVRLSDEGTYRALKRSGRIVAEERRGAWIYFAIQGELHVPLPGAQPGTADGALAIVTERFKARVAEEGNRR